MTTYRDAVRRLQIIYNDCSPQAKGKNVDKELDSFTRLKKTIHLDVKAARKMLKDREEILALKPGSKDAAELSHRIRAKIKQLREDATKLQAAQKLEEKKKKKSTDELGSSVNREEVVTLVFKHIEELEEMEKKRYKDKLTGDRSALFAGAAPVKIELTKFGDGKPGSSAAPAGSNSELPEIDDDPEVARELTLLQQGNRDIDADLEQIHTNVGNLKEIAINMDKELSKQNAMVDEIGNKVEKAQVHLENVNVKMKKALDGVMKGDKFIVNCVLICILLGLGTFIASYYI